MKEKWKAIDGSIVEIDSVGFNNKVKVGTVNGVRCVWDFNTGQCWGKPDWDLKERIDATTSSEPVR